jgi:uncharacterized protein (TIGR00369 family)
MTNNIEDYRKLCQVMLRSNRKDHFDAIGIKINKVDSGFVCMSIDYKESLVGNPDTGAVHGGVITTLLDSASGFAAGTVLDVLGLTPTIDLRIDYMGASQPHKTLYGEAEVYRNTRNIIFTRGLVHQGDKNYPIAHAVGTFAKMGANTFKGYRERILKAYDQLELPNE